MKSYRKDGMGVLVSSFIRNGLCRKYDCAEPFSEGFAVIGVRDEKKERWRCGYIEKTGASSLGHGSDWLTRFQATFTGRRRDVRRANSAEGSRCRKTEAEIEKEVARNKMKHDYLVKSGKFVCQPTN